MDAAELIKNTHFIVCPINFQLSFIPIWDFSILKIGSIPNLYIYQTKCEYMFHNNLISCENWLAMRRFATKTLRELGSTVFVQISVYIFNLFYEKVWEEVN